MRKWRGNYIALLAAEIYGLTTCDSLLAIEIIFDVDHDRILDKMI